jgi:hypothetical protein
MVFDFLILLDTVRVVLAAGQKHSESPRYAADLHVEPEKPASS